MEKDYEVLCTLGEGSFGKVYKSRHRRSGDEVAVKQIKIGSRSWEEACRSTELQALKALRHPFIVKLKELIRGQKDGSLYYIFEFLDSDLCHLLKYNPSGLEEIRAAGLIRQLFAGLSHMHQHCYFHRDIKPENILLDVGTESIRIADFGQARSIRALPPFTDYVGTRWYRAPECLLRDRAYSSPVDIWASGLIFAELLRGSPVFCGNSSIDQLYKIFTVLGPPPNDWPDFARLTQALRFRVPDRSCGLARVLPQGTPKCIGFLSEILAVNPRRRPVAKKCIDHVYFGNLPPLDLDRLEAQTQVSQSSRVDLERVDSPPALPQVTTEDASDFNERRGSKESKELSSDRKPSKESKETIAVPMGDDLTKDLDLDAELDAILGDASNDRAEPSGPSLPLGRACNRASSLPNLKPRLLSKSRSFEAIHSKRGLANYNMQPATVATAEDHLDRLLEDLDMEEQENDRVASVGKVAIQRLPTVGVAKVESITSSRTDVEVGFTKPLPLVSPCMSESSLEIDTRKQIGIGAIDAKTVSATIRTLHSDISMAAGDMKKPNHSIGCFERPEILSSFLQPNSLKTHSKSIDSKTEPRLGSEALRELLGSKSPGKASDLRNTSTVDTCVDVGEIRSNSFQALRELVASKSSANDSTAFKNASITGVSVDEEELRSNSFKGRAWTSDEAKRLRKVVKGIIRKGTRDKAVLWMEVSHEMGSGRSAKECKLQYARDYKAHKAKTSQETLLDAENAT